MYKSAAIADYNQPGKQAAFAFNVLCSIRFRYCSRPACPEAYKHSRFKNTHIFLLLCKIIAQY